MAKRVRRRQEALPAHPLIGFSEPVRAAGDHLIRVVLDPESKRWYVQEAPAIQPVSEHCDEAPPDLDYPFNSTIEALHAALRLQPREGYVFTIAHDPISGRCGFYEAPRRDPLPEGEIIGWFNTAGDATRAALAHLEPWWGDPQTLLLVEGGVFLPDMPSNARITADAGFRAAIDATVYDLDAEGLRAIHERTRQGGDVQARHAAIQYDIPIGQQVHAAQLLYDRLWPRHRRRADPAAPNRTHFLDELMPGVAKRRRQRHLKAFLIVSSEEWPFIQANATIEITGIDSIVQAARMAFPPHEQTRKPKTPLRERYRALRDALLNRRYEEGRRLALKFDEEDDEDAEEGSYLEENERR